MYYHEKEVFIESLNRVAKLYVGLPDNYETSNKSYPVLYMHDGQNVFTDKNAFGGVSWGLLEAYKKDASLPEIIVVGLECANGIERFDEYCPYDITFKPMLESLNTNKIGGKGDQYLDFLMNTLKPQIDKTYRTLPQAEHTAIMGSSMGGVISMYAALKHSDTFSRIGAVSGAYFCALDEFKDEIATANLNQIKKLYLDTGTKEIAGGNEEDYIRVNTDVYELLSHKLSPKHLQFELIEGGLHNESAWRERLPNIIHYLFS